MSTGDRGDRWAWLALLVSAAASANAAPPETFDLVGRGRLVGQVVATDDPGLIRVVVEGFAEPLELVTAAVVREDDAGGERRPLPGLPGRVGLLTAGDTRMLGCLAARDDGGIGWQPLGGTRPIPFAAAAAVRIEFRGLEAVGGPGATLTRQGAAAGWQVADIIPQGPAARDGRLAVGDRIDSIAEGAFGRPVPLQDAKADAVRMLLVGPVGSTVRFGVVRDGARDDVALVRDAAGCDDLAGAAAKDVLDRAAAVRQSLTGGGGRGASTVHLVSGESFACTVLAGDRRTLRVRLDGHGDLDVPAEQVRTIELSTAGVRPILKQKLARLLTLPRSQLGSPPTHVARMAGGDYLRGSFRGLDATTVQFEVADEVKQLPRRDVARIIRLAMPDERPPRLHAALADLGGLPLVVIGGDGRRRAVSATGMSGADIAGDSPALGKTTVSLGAATTVLVAAAIDEQPAADLPYAQWTLAPARGPRSADDGGR